MLLAYDGRATKALLGDHEGRGYVRMPTRSRFAFPCHVHFHGTPLGQNYSVEE